MSNDKIKETDTPTIDLNQYPELYEIMKQNLIDDRNITLSRKHDLDKRHVHMDVQVKLMRSSEQYQMKMVELSKLIFWSNIVLTLVFIVSVSLSILIR